MRTWRTANTQAEIDRIVADGDYPEIHGTGRFTVRGNARARACDSSSVTAYGSSSVTAYPYAAVHHLSESARVEGGVVITPPNLLDTKEWLAYYGVKIERGYAVLYKGVGEDWKSGYGTSYEPGTKPTAPDFAATNECGAGLTRAYGTPKRFLACKVRVRDLVVIGSERHADKVKAPTCTVLFEVDVHGRQMAEAAS